VGHITQLAVLSLAGNAIPHLPISFVKLKAIQVKKLASAACSFLIRIFNAIPRLPISFVKLKASR
jgi:hypothetical protein